MNLVLRSADKLFVKTTKRNPFLQISVYSLYYSSSLKKKHYVQHPDNFLDENEVVVSLTSKISSLVRWDQPKEAIDLFRTMLMSDQRPNFVTAVSVIRAVRDVGVESMAGEVHGLVIKLGIEFEVPVVTALVGLYSSWDMEIVWKLFYRAHYKDVVLWSAMVSACTRNKLYMEAFEGLRSMQSDGIEPDRVSVLSALQACARIGALQFGKQIHGFCIKRDQFYSYKNVHNSLVDMYAKCGNIKASVHIFDRIPDKDIVSWRIVIHGCVENECFVKALDMFVQMQCACFVLDDNIVLTVIGATLQAEELKFGLGLHCFLIKTGFLGFVSIVTKLLQMYSKFGEVGSARVLFSHLHQKDIIAYSAMISAHAQNGDASSAFDLYKQMQLANEKPNEITFVNLLQASSLAADEEIGEMIHANAAKSGYIPSTIMASALIDLYCKSGRIRQAKLLFDETPNKDLICWSSLINGYGKNGLGREAVDTFSNMLNCHIKPNDVVFLSILSACSQCGLESEGRKWFYAMKETYGITPRLSHYACMVDLLSRRGYLKEGLEFVSSMPVEPDERIWGSLLAGCRKFNGSDKIAEIAARKLIDLDPENHSYYMFLSSLYAEQSRWEDVEAVRKLVNKKGLQMKIIMEENDKGFIELIPSQYNVVLKDGTYNGELKLGIRFTPNTDIHPERKELVEEEDEEETAKTICKALMNFWKILRRRFLHFCRNLNDDGKHKET